MTHMGRREWQSSNIIPVMVAWLIFYSIAIFGALTGPQTVPTVTAQIISK